MEEAVRLFKLAADQGHIGAICDLGIFFKIRFNLALCGVFISFNSIINLSIITLLNCVFFYLRFSAGYCYKHGLGTSKDDKLAVKFYRLAADQGNMTAAYNLGEFNSVLIIAPPSLNHLIFLLRDYLLYSVEFGGWHRRYSELC